MPRFAIIKDEQISNVIVADQEFIEANYPSAIEAPDFVGVGDSFIKGKFQKVEIISINEPETI